MTVFTSSNLEAAAGTRPSPLPHFDLGGRGRPLHFLHANGYPPACYQPLLDGLNSDYRVFGMLLRPLWQGADPSSIRDWTPFSDDLLEFLEQYGATRTIGVGHSIGAVVTLRAALREPERFSALVLLDPVLLPRKQILLFRALRALGLEQRMRRRIEATLRRRRTFSDLEQLFTGYRRRDIFRFFSDAHLRALIQGITRPAPGGYELAYSPEWEARIYETGIWKDLDIWAGLRALTIPTLIIRGVETDTFWQTTGKQVQSLNAGIRVVAIPDATHLVPMERAEEVARAIREFTAGLG